MWKTVMDSSQNSFYKKYDAITVYNVPGSDSARHFFPLCICDVILLMDPQR